MNLINQIYQQAETHAKLRDHFNEDPEFRSVTLSQFFTKDGLEQILNEIVATEFVEDNNEIIHRRKRAGLTDTLDQLLAMPDFLSMVSTIAEDDIDSFQGSLYKFGHGDYRIINDDAVLPPGYDIVIDLTPEWDDQLGGYVAYTDGEGNFHTLPANFGSVTLVKRTAQYHYFVKYVNHYAENLNRYLVIADSEVET